MTDALGAPQRIDLVNLIALVALLGHSGSQTSQLMHSSVISRAMEYALNSYQLFGPVCAILSTRALLTSG